MGREICRFKLITLPFQDDVLETSSTFSNRLTSYDNAKYSGGNTTAVIESLQAQLKQREGETVQLQMEISGLERVKTGLSAELAKLNQKADKAIDLEAKLEDLRLKYQEVEQKYQTMLTVSFIVELPRTYISIFYLDVSDVR